MYGEVSLNRRLQAGERTPVARNEQANKVGRVLMNANSLFLSCKIKSL